MKVKIYYPPLIINKLLLSLATEDKMELEEEEKNFPSHRNEKKKLFS